MAMKHPRRKFLQFAGATTATVLACPNAAISQTFPSRPITMIVPLAAGGALDAVGRILAERMRGALRQPIIIEYVGGADGSIGTGRAARARPDGYTLDLGFFGTHVLNGAIYSLPYDVVNDFAPIVPLVRSPLVLFARKTMPANDFNQLIDWLMANPGSSLGYGAPGPHMVAALFAKQTRTRSTLVPYRDLAPAIQDLVAGQIDLSFGGPDALPLAQAASIKAYAVTSDTRLALAPDLPTFGELGLPALTYFTWWAIFAPKGTPGDIIGRLNAAAVEALADPAVRSRFADLGLEIFPRDRQTPGALGALVRTDTDKWWPVIKESGIKAAP
jgi:tripartite-type tricarboxylate transporter receptor subunit TctC